MRRDPAAPGPAREPLLEVRSLNKTYARPSWLGRGAEVRALSEVSLALVRGGTLGVVGRSGSGKSTLARCIAGRERPDAGEVRFEGHNVFDLAPGEWRQFRRAVQLIPQDPGASLNPRLAAWRIVSEPLAVAGVGDAAARRAHALALLRATGLSPETGDWPPSRFSGGQRARLALARALAARPRLLILDESLAALDLSVRAQMINLLLDLQKRFDLSYLLITHDLSLAGHFAAEIAVLDGGRLIERGAPAELFRGAAHPCTRALVAAAPVLTRSE